MPKSILIYTPSLKFGGAEKALVTLANGLAEASYPVTYCYSENGQLSKELRPSIPRINLVKLRMLTSIFPLYSVLRKHKPDVIITTLFHCNIVVLLIGLVYNFLNVHKVEVIVRETTNISVRLKAIGRVKCFIFKHLIKLLYPKAKAVVFPNESLKAKFKSYFGLKVNNAVVIYNSSHFDASLVKKKKKIFFSEGQKLTLLSVGRLTKTKRVEDLLYAAAQLKKDYILKVDIVGDGPEEESLKKLTKSLNLNNIVNFKGFQSYPFKAYSPKNTLFILTSELEGMPNALIEALCSGFPCISADCDYGPFEIFHKFNINKHWLYPPRHVDELTSRVGLFFSSLSNYDVDYLKGYKYFSFEQCLYRYKGVIGG